MISLYPSPTTAFRQFLKRENGTLTDFIIHSFNLGKPTLNGFVHPKCENKQASLSAKLYAAYWELESYRNLPCELVKESANLIHKSMSIFDSLTNYYYNQQITKVNRLTSKSIKNFTKFRTVPESEYWEELICSFVHEVFFGFYDHEAHNPSEHYMWGKVFKDYGLEPGMRSSKNIMELIDSGL